MLEFSEIRGLIEDDSCRMISQQHCLPLHKILSSGLLPATFTVQRVLMLRYLQSCPESTFGLLERAVWLFGAPDKGRLSVYLFFLSASTMSTYVFLFPL